MKRSHIGDFLDEFALPEAGRACLSNLIYDLAYRRVSFRVVFLALIAATGEWLRAPHPVRDVVSIFWYGVKSGGTDPLVCSGPRLAEPAEGCSRVIEMHDLIEFHLDRRALPIGIGERMSRRRAAVLERGNLDVFVDPKKGPLRTGRPMAWVTPRADIDPVIRAHPAGLDRAVSVVNQAGLANARGGYDLVALHYPPGFFAHGELRAPVFVDGDALDIYRSKVGTDLWGVAVELETHTDGVREAVHREKPFGKGFTLTWLGPASRPPRPSGRSFLRTFPIAWSSSHKNRIIGRCVQQDPTL